MSVTDMENRIVPFPGQIDDGPRALVYDDDDAFAEECAEMLARRGYRVETRSGRSDFASLLARARPNLLVLDLHMPEFDGIEALRVIRDDKRRDETAIVVVSAAEPLMLESAEKIAHAYGLHLRGVLRKPFRIAELEALLAADDKSLQSGPPL